MGIGPCLLAGIPPDTQRIGPTVLSGRLAFFLFTLAADPSSFLKEAG
jgi:hypothetical protein